jgi:hypothetical protein
VKAPSNKDDPGERREHAESLAVRALLFLADDAHRLARFLAFSGIDAGRIRFAAAEPRFLAGVLEHLSSDERLLLSFAEHVAVDPGEIRRAWTVLAGTAHERREL